MRKVRNTEERKTKKNCFFTVFTCASFTIRSESASVYLPKGANTSTSEFLNAVQSSAVYAEYQKKKEG
jgi:hypothetical protein